MTLLTEDTFDEDTNRDKSLISNLEYATGDGNLFTQPPPPTIAADVESLADEVEDTKNDDRDNMLHESDSEDSNDEGDDLLAQMMDDTDHVQVDKKPGNLIRENDCVETKICICKDDRKIEKLINASDSDESNDEGDDLLAQMMDDNDPYHVDDKPDKSICEDDGDKKKNCICKDDNKTDNLMVDDDTKSDSSLSEQENNKSGDSIRKDDDKNDTANREDDVQTKHSTDHEIRGFSRNNNNNTTMGKVDDVKKGTEETSEEVKVPHKMDDIILTEESFLQFIDKDFDNDVESNQVSLVDDDKNPESGKDTIGSKPSTDKPEISNNKKDKIRFHGSVTEEKNDVLSLVPVVNARDSKLAAMKKVVRKEQDKQQ